MMRVLFLIPVMRGRVAMGKIALPGDVGALDGGMGCFA